MVVGLPTSLLAKRFSSCSGPQFTFGLVIIVLGGFTYAVKLTNQELRIRGARKHFRIPGKDDLEMQNFNPQQGQELPQQPYPSHQQTTRLPCSSPPPPPSHSPHPVTQQEQMVRLPSFTLPPLPPQRLGKYISSNHQKARSTAIENTFGFLLTI